MRGRSIRRYIGRCSSAAITPPKQQRKDCGKPFSISTRAIAKDPANALAHAGLAEAYIGLSGFYVDPREAMPKAKRAAETALAPGRVARRRARGARVHPSRVRLGRTGCGEGAPARARSQSDAGDGPLELRGVPDHARHAMTRRSGRFGGRSSSIRCRYGPTRSARLCLLFARRYDEAIELARRGLEFEPNSAFTLAFQGVAYAEQGRFKEAVANLRTSRATGRQPDDSGPAGARPCRRRSEGRGEQR